MEIKDEEFMKTEQRIGSPPRRLVVAAAAVCALVLGLCVPGAAPALAASGDYDVEITSPETVRVTDGFTYTVTIDGEPIIEGAELSVQLPDGVAFESVPLGDGSPVESYEYDPETGVVTFKLKDLEEPLSSFVFSVTQDENQNKDDSTIFDATITGNETPSGKIPSDSTSTEVVGTWNYEARKSHATVVGSGNREVTYSFDIAQGGSSFTTWAQQLTDVIPAGAEITGTSTGFGEWTLTENADGTTTAVWDHDGIYGPSSSTLMPGKEVWITVVYPEDVFPDGSLPPENVVELDVKDASGNWIDQKPGSTQGPELSEGNDKKLAIDKTINDGRNSTVGHGAWATQYKIQASYL